MFAANQKLFFSFFFQCLQILNKLGLTLTPRSKLNILEQCGKETMMRARALTSEHQLCHFVGDNCDIRMSPRMASGQVQARDYHFFGLLLIFSRLARELETLNNITPELQPQQLTQDFFLLSLGERDAMLQSYKVMLGRLLVRNMPGFRWLQNVLPVHIPHQHSQQMATKSTVLPLELILKDEKKYEDCFSILLEVQRMLSVDLQGELTV